LACFNWEFSMALLKLIGITSLVLLGALFYFDSVLPAVSIKPEVRFDSLAALRAIANHVERRGLAPPRLTTTASQEAVSAQHEHQHQHTSLERIVSSSLDLSAASPAAAAEPEITAKRPKVRRPKLRRSKIAARRPHRRTRMARKQATRLVQNEMSPFNFVQPYKPDGSGGREGGIATAPMLDMNMLFR
jgi:hypothetical protein